LNEGRAFPVAAPSDLAGRGAVGAASAETGFSTTLAAAAACTGGGLVTVSSGVISDTLGVVANGRPPAHGRAHRALFR
jgi:hypothetical protein